LISTILLILITAKTPQGTYGDAAWQMKAVQQYLAGQSPSINHVVMPDVKDLSQDSAGWIYWWPPGPQFLVYPLMASGVALGDAVRITVILLIFSGSLGWILWFLSFRLPNWVVITLAIALPWMHSVSTHLFLYSADIITYALAPWVLLAAYHLGEAWVRRQNFSKKILAVSALFGFSMGLLYLFKYSTILVSLGALVYLGCKAFHGKKLKSDLVMISFILAVVFFIIPVISYSLLNNKFGNIMNPVMARLDINSRWENFLFVLANPSLAIADANSMCSYIFLHPEHGLALNFPLLPEVLQGSLLLGFIGLPGGIFLLWLLLRQADSKNREPLALTVFFTVLTAMLATWLFSSEGAAYDARFLASASIAVLPVAIQKGYRSWHNGRVAMRWVLAVMAISYVVIPLMYGVISVIGKVMMTPNYRLGPSHIYDPGFARVDLLGVRDRLLQDFSSDTDIWYFSSPVTALSFSQRAIFRDADFDSLDELKQDKFISSSPLHVHALLLPRFESNGKGQTIRDSFVQAGKWEKTQIDGCNYILWTTTLNNLPNRQ